MTSSSDSGGSQDAPGGTRASMRVGDATLRVMRGDLTALAVDAVVNAANEQLRHGGGVALALARAGGGEVQRASDAWVAEHGPVGPGQAAVTTAGRMPARYVVHVVGPRYRRGQDNPGLLTQAVHAALDAADDVGATSVAMPAVSAGIFGYPPDDATQVIAQASIDWLARGPDRVRDVALVGYDDATAELFAAALEHVTQESDG